MKVTPSHPGLTFCSPNSRAGRVRAQGGLAFSREEGELDSGF